SGLSPTFAVNCWSKVLNMIKHLPLIISLFLFLPAVAQTPVDSLSKRPATDTAKSAAPPDSVMRKQLIESVKGMPSDSVARQEHADFLKKQTADSLAKVNQLKTADSLAKSLAADSLLRQAHTDSVKQAAVDTGTKSPPPVKEIKTDTVAK